MYKKTIAKKDLEYHLLRTFISNESLQLRVKSIESTETPDFIVRELTRDISIEVTRLIHPHLIQVEAFQENLVESAYRKFKEKYSAKLRVLVNFSNVPIKCKKSEIGMYVDQLHDLVEGIYLPNRKYSFNISSRGRCRPINHFIDSISVSNDLDFENWQPFGAYLVKDVDVDWIKRAIQEKEKNIKRYPTKFDENWLLLVANFGHKSSTHGFGYLEQEKFASQFDKIYLYKYMDNIIDQLK
ncbi:hypothetical protein [Chitinophaga polysaccharea]|uniref:hypothetical protein n=1 Tax=Chitinophaga polysaccharea TaxID=1293035 RepID=UPI00115B87B3|nr:hypothetical protein [Chitinophaga polysaccharea]